MPNPASEMIQALSGQAVALFAFDIGYEVHLDALRDVQASFPLESLSKSKQKPSYVQYTVTPHVLDLGETTLLPGWTGKIQATLFDFGAVSIAYRWSLTQHPSAKTLPDLPALSEQLYDAELEDDARRQVERLLQHIEHAVDRPEISDIVEDYYVFILDSQKMGFSETEPISATETQPFQATDFLQRNQAVLAQTLRSETLPLSRSQQQEALLKPITYYESDLVLVDWNAAIIVDTDYSDTLTVLELLNIKLLEARYTDTRLMASINHYEDTILRNSRRFIFPLFNPYRHMIGELAEWRLHASLMTDRIDNALKIIGDLYLYKIYTVASERFNLPEWETSISRKVDIITSLYQLLTDRVSTMQGQALELVIIVLILIEILMGLN
jgi:hypothetical protein